MRSCLTNVIDQIIDPAEAQEHIRHKSQRLKQALALAKDGQAEPFVHGLPSTISEWEQAANHADSVEILASTVYAFTFRPMEQGFRVECIELILQTKPHEPSRTSI